VTTGQDTMFPTPSGRQTMLMYPDGSCLDCQPFGDSRSSLTSSPGLDAGTPRSAQLS
jgi:hypothetical protein